MFKRNSFLFAILLIMALLLAACGGTAGDESNQVPVYQNATKVEIGKDLESNFNLSTYKEVKISGYKSSEPPEKVKTFFAEEFKKREWKEENKAGDKSRAASASQASQLGGFNLIFVKESHAASIIAMSGSNASSLGLQDVAPNDLFYFVVEGKK